MAAGALNLRRAAACEVDEIARIHLASRRVAMPWLPVLHSEVEVRHFFADRVMRECEVWVAEGDAVLGSCAFREGWVEHLYVDPSAQGAGVGSALLAKAMASGRALKLWVFQRNLPAIRFYEARGFQLVRKTDGSDNEEKEPDALYAWTV
jgi:ribosomal protein S18 acetylase RimI-like enzyme